MKIRVQAPSRLHFGLLSLPGERGEQTHWRDRDGVLSVPARHYGSVGLMIERPGLGLTVASSDHWSAEGPSARRAIEYAKLAASRLEADGPFHIRVERCPPEHIGLGTGTQLGLAIARAIAEFDLWGMQTTRLQDLARAVKRGQRSALGAWGFEHGGFLVDGGKKPEEDLAPLIYQHAFPAEWLVLLIVPAGVQGVHGPQECEAFSSLARAATDQHRTDALCRLVLLGMLPALGTGDFEGFGEALYDFNRRVGEMFLPWQGGLYSHPRVAEIISWIRACGVKGVGQSSWGPTVFAIVTADQADELTNRLIDKHGIAEQELILSAASRGAVISASDPML